MNATNIDNTITVIVKPLSKSDMRQSSANEYINGTAQQIYFPPLNISQNPIANDESIIKK